MATERDRPCRPSNSLSLERAGCGCNFGLQDQSLEPCVSATERLSLIRLDGLIQFD